VNGPSPVICVEVLSAERGFALFARLRTERDDALRTISFLEEESNSRLDDVESRLRGCTARSFKLERDLAETTAKLSAADETAANLRRQNERVVVEAKRLQACATGTAIIFQHLDNQGGIMVNKLDGAYALISQLRENESQMQENLELERVRSADLQRRLHDSQEDLAMHPAEREHALQREMDRAEHDDFNIEELAQGAPADPRMMDYDDAGESHQCHRITDGPRPAHDVKEEPSFSEAALGYSLHPASPTRSRHSDQTLASSNALGSPHSSRYDTHSSRPLPPPNTPSDPHVGCRKQLNELQARIGRRNEQIGHHQAEIARLTMNLTLAEEANAEHMAEWDKLNGERNEVALERDAMVADCAEVREARNDALRRSDVFEEEIDSLRAHIAALQDQFPVSTSHPSSASCYTVEQITALVKEVILATGRAQSLESSLAEAHDALTEACELEGHLIDLQSKRDELAAELEVTRRENDRVTSQMDAKEKEVTQVQSALAAAQVEALAARDETRSVHEERQRFTVQVEELRKQLNDTHTQYALFQQRSKAKLQELNDAFRDAEEAAQAARVRGEAAESDLHDAKMMLQQEVDLLAARCSDLELQLGAAVESAEQKSSEYLGQMESYARDLTSLRIERDQAMSTAAEAQASLESAETAANERVAHAEAAVEKVTADCCQMNADLENARAIISELEQSVKAAKDDLLIRIEELRRVNGMKRFLEMDMKKRYVSWSIRIASD
jgi:chromosome segregation ATPase